MPDDLASRIPEPELMEDAEQAAAYAGGDFAAAHDTAVALFGQRFPEFGSVPCRVLDLGCGPADVTVRFARAYPRTRIDAVDGSEAMLSLGRTLVSRHGLSGRIDLHPARLPALPGAWGGEAGGYDAVISSSLLHHLDDPAVLWDTVTECARPGAAVFVWDLARPAGLAGVEDLVSRYAAGEHPLLQRDFRSSLLAAYRPAEVRDQLAASGLPFTVEAVGDRHLIVWGSRP